MNNIKVSIITVSYNAEQTIEQTIKSVIGQTYPNIEYIIVDGASTDLTCQIIDQYRLYVNMVISEKDEGLYYAMNKGISYATGDIVGILNCDDVYTEEAVSKIVEYYQKTDADVIYGNAMRIEHEKEIGIYRCENIEELWYRMVIPHPATFVKTEVYKKYGGFNTKYQIAADYELLLRLYCNCLKFGYMDEIITYFRMGGKSDQNPKICIEEAKEIALYYISQCNRKDYYLKRIYEKYYESYLEYFLNNDRQIIEKAIGIILNSHSVRKIAIWGTGKWGRRMVNVMRNVDIKIECFIDNDKMKQYQSIYGIVTNSPEFLKTYTGGVLIAVCKYENEILEQIKGINNNLFALTLEDIGKYALNKSGLEQT